MRIYAIRLVKSFYSTTKSMCKNDIVDTNITSFIAVTDKDKVMDLLHTIKDKTEKLDKSIMREQITGLQDNIDKTIEKAQSVKEENKDDL